LAEPYDLKDSKQSVRELYPVLRDAHGNVIDGNHRLEVDPEWRSETLEHIRTPTQLALARIVANTHRRIISREERAEQITELARSLIEHDEVPREEIVATISDLTTFSADYIRRLLPDEFKIRAGVGGAGTHQRVGLSPIQQEEVAFVDETDRRDLRPLLEQPASPAADPEVVASINTMVGEPVEALQAKLMEQHGLTEEEADAALESHRETYPDIWSVCYPEKDEEPEEPLTAEQYVADVLTHNPEVSHEELARVTAEMFGVNEAYAQGLIDRKGQKRGPKPRDPYAARSPKTPCPLCGRANAEMNKILMVLEEYQATQPGITLVDWLKEVLA